ncbi:MAG: hypothetical protein AB2L11_05440 [Syntrophobacteraceae bacterium]
MKENSRILDETSLGNGLIAYFYDQSKPIVGDRWQVQLLLYVPLEVKESHFEGCAEPKKSYEAFTAQFGPAIAFKQVRTRNFIADKEFKSLLHTMKEELLRSCAPYISKPQFAEKHIRKTISEWYEDAACRTAHAEAIRRADEGA